MSYSLNSPQKFSTSTPNATCNGYAFQSPYDNQYNVPFCQKAQMAYVGPDKVSYGFAASLMKENQVKENYNPSYDPNAVPMGCNDGCPPGYYMYTSTTNTPSKCYCRPK
jgi:hypothetical protein